MHNPHRGEVSVRFNGRTYKARLSLQALAEIETALSTSVAALAERAAAGALSAHELSTVIAAGVRAEPTAVAASDLTYTAAASAVCRMLGAAFAPEGVR